MKFHGISSENVSGVIMTGFFPSKCSLGELEVRLSDPFLFLLIINYVLGSTYTLYNISLEHSWEAQIIALMFFKMRKLRL